MLWNGCSAPEGAPKAVSLDSAPTKTAKAADRGLLITGAHLISAERDQPLQDAWVHIEGGKILAVGHGDPSGAAPEAEVLDARGRFLIPGLIDSHVHLLSIPGMDFPRSQEHKGLVEAYLRQMPRSYLYHGFTTLLDLAPNDPKALEEIMAGKEHPDLYSCGLPVPLANGYPMLFAPPPARFEVFSNFLYDPRQADEIPRRYAPENHDPAAAVARAKGSGGVCVKAFVEDGFGLAKRWPVPTAEMIQALHQEAEKAGLPLVVHANSYDAYALALEGGADILVHGLWTWDEFQHLDDGATLPIGIRDLLGRMTQGGTASMPTLRVIAGDQALFDPSFLEDPALRKVLPKELLEWYASEEGQWFGRQMLEDQPLELRTREAAFEGHQAPLERASRVAAYLANQGAPLLFGSDTPSGPSYGNPPGYNGYLELEALAAAGVPLPSLFSSATLSNARAFQLDDRYGTIEAGKVANLLVLTENPLEKVEAYDSIETVILHGRRLDRDALAVELP